MGRVIFTTHGEIRFVNSMAARKGSSGFLSRISSSFKPVTGYQAYGLRLEDFYNAENPEIQEVLRRLPNKTKEERDLRIRRGHELHLKGATLPESSWTTPEEDGQTYMEPYMSEVVQEIEERKDFRADFLLPVEKRHKRK